jgi:hypothetical protein
MNEFKEKAPQTGCKRKRIKLKWPVVITVLPEELFLV